MSRMDAANWRPSEMCRFKVNTDVLDLVKGKVAIGVIIRDHLGDVLASRSQPFLAHFPASCCGSSCCTQRSTVMRGCSLAWWRRMLKWW
ncbi:hypothetical protein Ddye_002018 [Dipteronia dyeriana]|uniref:Uncharacterized protein n=1 Tax=Dipteronia dyeriana TaxID=168575 RepID=A0AAE0CU29_9ROSI|nr:hypothetical protein Ddye_002018 [Dipteronia dyeriana]